MKTVSDHADHAEGMYCTSLTILWHYQMIVLAPPVHILKRLAWPRHKD